jgi:predicted alpha/beta superfamily hydrolase
MLQKGKAVAVAVIAACAVLVAACSEESLLGLFLPREGDGVEVRSLESSAIGQKYAVYVGLPDSYSSGLGSYPLAIMTDGDWDFSSVWPDVRRSMRNGATDEFILVGLGYGRGEDGRGRDYTPTRSIKWEKEQYGDEGGPISGGADAFLDFLSGELIPFIDANYRVTAGRERRCLAGHSLGGLLALYVSVKRPDIFSSVVASSPSLYWDSRVAFSFLGGFIADPAKKDAAFVYASIGSQEGFPNDVLLDEWMRRAGAIPGFTTDQRYFPDTVHSQVQTVSLPEGLRAAFRKELP